MRRYTNVRRVCLFGTCGHAQVCEALSSPPSFFPLMMTELTERAILSINLVSPGLTREHCEGRHRITGKSGAAKWVEAHKQLELSLAAAAATAKDQLQRSQVGLEEDVRAALKDGIISEEEQEVLEQKKDMLKAAKQIYAMLKSAKELNSAAWLDAKKATVMRKQVDEKQRQQVSSFNNVVSEFEHELSQEEQNQDKVMLRFCKFKTASACLLERISSKFFSLSTFDDIALPAANLDNLCSYLTTPECSYRRSRRWMKLSLTWSSISKSRS